MLKSKYIKLGNNYTEETDYKEMNAFRMKPYSKF